MSGSSKTDLVALSRTGDKKAYSKLVKLNAGRVFGICLGILGNTHDAEDAAQQTLLKGFADIGKLRNSELFERWICKIARNLCIDIIRRRIRERDAAGKYISKEEHNLEEYSFLKAALASLPEKYRTVLMLYYFDGKKTKNIGQILDISQAAVHVRMMRARKELRKILETERDLK